MQSDVAPTSRMTTLPWGVGSTVAIAGRCTDSMRPSPKRAAATTAPVFPAETMASVRRSFSSRAAMLIEESFFFRTEVTADSPISTRSEAWITEGREEARWRRADLEGARGLARRFDGPLDDHTRGEVASHGVHTDDRPSGSLAHLGPVPAAPTNSWRPPERSLLRPRSSRSGRTPDAEASAGCSGDRATGMASRVSSSCGASCRGCSSVFSWVRPSSFIPFARVFCRGV